MFFNESKAKRHQIMEQISLRETSKQQKRKSSVERRRKIQSNFNDFVKTMSNISYSRTGGTQQFAFQKSTQSFRPNNQQSNKSQQESNINQKLEEASRSPSFKDILVQRSPQKLTVEKQVLEQQLKDSHFYNSQRNDVQTINIDQSNKKSQSQSNKRSQQQSNKRSQQQIVRDNLPHEFIPQQQKIIQQSKHFAQNIIPTTIQNDSSNSALFFTSQFQQFLNNKAFNSISDRPQTIAQPSQQQIPALQDKINQKSIKNIDQQKQLNKNKSIDSLISNSDNSSLLRYSMAESSFKEAKELIQHKLVIQQHQLNPYDDQFNHSGDPLNHSLSHEQFNNSNHHTQSMQLYHIVKIQMITDKLIISNWRSFYSDFAVFAKLFKLKEKIKTRQKNMFYQAFIINKQLNFQAKKNQLKCDKYLKQKQLSLIEKVFNDLKQQYFVIPHKKQQAAQQMLHKREISLEQKIFRHLKISWYNKKVNKQISLYYLSKLFSHFNRVLKKQSQSNRSKSLLQYCYWLKKRMFNKFRQGIQKTKDQQRKIENAQWFHQFSLQRKIFESWRERTRRNQREIQLKMTMTNTFKQTDKQKFVQIRTIDFRQIK